MSTPVQLEKYRSAWRHLGEGAVENTVVHWGLREIPGDNIGISFRPLDPRRHRAQGVTSSGIRHPTGGGGRGFGGRKAHSSPSASSDGNEGGPPGPTGEPDAAKVGGFPAGGPVTGSGSPRSTRIRCPLQGRPTRLSAGQRCHHERGPEELGRLRPTGYSGPRRVRNALERRRPWARLPLRRCRPTGWGGGAPMPPGTRGSRGPSAGPADG